MNKVFLIGNLSKEPELSETNNGTAVCKLSVAVNRPTAKEGMVAVDFIPVIVWSGLAENCNKYLSKGKKVGVVGTLKNRSYEDKNGVKKTVTEVIASEVEFLSPAEKKEQTEQQVQDDELPF